MKRTGLGRNLSALLQSAGTSATLEAPLSLVIQVPVTNLIPSPFQPRLQMDEEALNLLAESIKNQGLLQPIVARKNSDEQYEIIAGERRWRAAQLAELTEVPVMIRQVNDETAMALALIENLQRENLNALEKAQAIQRLINEFDLTHQSVAHLLSQSRSQISNLLRLLQLTARVKSLLEQNRIEVGHARALLMLNETDQIHVADLIVNKNLSVRETEKIVANLKSKENKEKPLSAYLNSFHAERVAALSKYLARKVQLKPGKGGQGSLVIHYENEANLFQLMESLMRE